MTEWIMGMFGILLYLFEGYCIRFFFGRFAEPRLHRLRNVDWAAGIAWIVIRIAGGVLFRETDSVTLIVELIKPSVRKKRHSGRQVWSAVRKQQRNGKSRWR